MIFPVQLSSFLKILTYDIGVCIRYTYSPSAFLLLLIFSALPPLSLPRNYFFTFLVLRIKWFKLKKGRMLHRAELRQALGGREELPDDWESTAEVVREPAEKVYPLDQVCQT